MGGAVLCDRTRCALTAEALTAGRCRPWGPFVVAIRGALDRCGGSLQSRNLGGMGDFKNLRVWRYAHALMLNVHGAATGMRGAQYLSLRSQIIRAAMSIPANVVEGSARKSDRDFARFLGYSIASTRELEYHLLAARDIGAITPETFNALSAQLTDVRKMLYGLVTKLESRPPSNGPRKVPAQ